MMNIFRIVLVAIVLSSVSTLAVAADKEAPKKEEPKKDPKADATKKDPKDMNIDEAEAAGLCPVDKIAFKLIYHHDVKDKTYHFCSRKCMTTFKDDPTKFTVKK